MNGILCLDKPENISSFAACSAVRHALGEDKAGHTGTLDPMATGVLPILLGKATKALDYLPSHDKRYLLTLRFGMTSDTQDIWGEVTPTGKPIPALHDVETALNSFRGEIWQIPPMVSALKQNGVRLYALARKGVEVEREKRKITIYSLTLCRYEGDTLQLDLSCSRGAYMRTLAADLGQVLGCGAVMTALRRTEAAGFTLKDCLTLEQVREIANTPDLSAYTVPIERALDGYPPLTVTAAQAVRFQNGGFLSLDRLPTEVTGTVRVFAPDGHFLGLGTPESDSLAVEKLLS